MNFSSTHTVESPARLNTTSLRYSPCGLQRTYGVTIDIDNDYSRHAISYEMMMKCDEEPDDDQFVFELYQKNFVIDGQLIPDSVFDELALHCRAVCYPLQVTVNRWGKLTGIANHADIKKRWPAVKAHIKNNYHGEAVNIYLDATETSLLNPVLFEEMLRRDWFMTLFFQKIITNYGFKYEAQGVFELPLLPNEPLISTPVNLQLSNTYTTYGTVVIAVTEQATGTQTAHDLQMEQDKAFAKINFNAIYDLDADTCLIRTVRSEIKTDLPGGERMRVVFKAFHLEEYDTNK